MDSLILHETNESSTTEFKKKKLTGCWLPVLGKRVCLLITIVVVF